MCMCVIVHRYIYIYIPIKISTCSSRPAPIFLFTNLHRGDDQQEEADAQPWSHQNRPQHRRQHAHQKVHAVRAADWGNEDQDHKERQEEVQDLDFMGKFDDLTV